MSRTSGTRSRRGVTLLELMIAVMLVAILSLGLLYAMRTGLMTYQKINARLSDNRRAMGMQQALELQIGGLMPITQSCGGGTLALFSGTPASARFVSSYSVAEGARGYPRIVEYQVQPDPLGGVRLMMNERLYAGPATTVPLCTGQGFIPVQLGPQALEVAGPLAFCRFSYREAIPESPMAGLWFPFWNKPEFPRIVRIDMESLHPNPSALPVVSLNIPVRITRQLGVPYVDQP
jgi:prepilin-type N-terminal cleavage/methylation domain-containing protein